MKRIKAADLKMDQWTDQTFEADSLDDLIKQATDFMTSDTEAAKASGSFSQEDKDNWYKMAKTVWDAAPEA